MACDKYNTSIVRQVIQLLGRLLSEKSSIGDLENIEDQWSLLRVLFNNTDLGECVVLFDKQRENTGPFLGFDN